MWKKDVQETMRTAFRDAEDKSRISAGLRYPSRWAAPDVSPGVTIGKKNARDQAAWLSWDAG